MKSIGQKLMKWEQNQIGSFFLFSSQYMYKMMFGFKTPCWYQHQWYTTPGEWIKKHFCYPSFERQYRTIFAKIDTVSILHPQLARSAPKVASWMQNSKFWKSLFLNFLIRPIESSVQKESSSHPYHQTILWSHTLGPALSNALSITFIRHL